MRVKSVEADNRCFFDLPEGHGPFIEPTVKRRGGGPRPMTAAERVAHFWARVERGDGCWLWTGNTTPDGYGLVACGRRPDGRVVNDYAHRISYWLTTGVPIPAGLVVRHRCDNPPCARPDHLLLGTQGDNLNDCRLRGRMPAQRPGAWLVPAEIRAAAIAARKRGELAAIARQTGFGLQQLAMIRRRALAKAAAHV